VRLIDWEMKSWMKLMGWHVPSSRKTEVALNRPRNPVLQNIAGIKRMKHNEIAARDVRLVVK
jgi:hypothetical protein